MSLRSETVHAAGLLLVEHELDVPLEHTDPDGPTITVFAREVADPGPGGRERPFLVYLQGGPGSEAPRPTRLPTSPAWLDRALQDYRVLMLDQRGTGRSTPVGTLPGLTPAEQAAYLAHFRADAIVRDCEAFRAALGVDTWSVLGQSFGGFCTLTYLSQAPGSLREALFTGGVPPVGRPVDEVYATTYRTMRERNRRYHATYPGDRDRLRAILDRAAAGELVLPSGDVVTPRWFRQVGNVLGMSDGAARLHYLLELDPSSPAFLHDLAGALPFHGRNPLYVVVHEACYADGEATRWSADRVMPDDFREDDTLLTGEHVGPRRRGRAAAPARGGAPAGREGVATALRRRRARGRGRGLRRGSLRAPRLLAGDRRAGADAAPLGHQRVRAQRPARRRRACARPARQDGPRPALTVGPICREWSRRARPPDAVATGSTTRPAVS